MKKLSYILSGLLLFTTIGIFSSCGDNENYWGLHNLTDEEIAEMDRQQRIKDSLRNVIDAGLILTYDAEITISANSYDGVDVPIDCDAIAQFFGITTDQLLTGSLAGEDNGIDIIGFAIEGSTHADNMTMSNTGAPWGHWWDAKGDVINWGDGAMTFAEFNAETGAFYVGQFPGRLVEGENITFIEALKYQDKRAAIVITAKPHERGEVTAQVVATNHLTLETEQDNNYTAVPVPGFDAAATLSALGVASFDEVAWVAVNADGSYAQEYSADAPGFWYDKLGFSGSWGDDASVYSHFDAESQAILIGQMPNQMEAGSTVTVSFGALANNKIVMNEITVNITAKGDVAGEIVATNNLTLTCSPNNDYVTAAVPGFDAAATLSALGATNWSEVKWTTPTEDGYAQDYNADAPGFWYGQDGKLGAWGNDASVFAHFDAATETIGIGQMPEKMPAGSTVTIEFDAAANGKLVQNIITVNVVAYEDPETAPAGNPESIEKDITLTKVYDNEWGATDDFDVKEDLRQAFKMTTYQIYSAIKSGELKMWIDEVGKPADDAGNPAYTGEAPGYWLDMEGQAASWGSGNELVYVFLGCSETELYFYAANHPELFPAEGGSMKVKYVIECNGVTATYNITFNITPAA